MNLEKKKKENKKKSMNIEQNAKHAVHATQIGRQLENTAYTHDTDS